MKSRLILLVLVTMLTRVGVFPQGVIEFQNHDPAAGINAPTFLQPGIRVDGADPLFRAALLAGPVLGSTPAGPGGPGNLTMLASPVSGATWVGFGTGTDAGYINIGSDSSRVVPNVGWGQQAMVQMVAWYGNYTTWDEAYKATGADSKLQIGASLPFGVIFPQVPSGPVKLLGLSSFTFVYVPEPQTSALAGLALIVFLFRRFLKGKASNI